jgi:hypothetical protein
MSVPLRVVKPVVALATDGGSKISRSGQNVLLLIGDEKLM